MVTTSLKRGRSSYDRQLKKGRATLTLLNFIFIYSIDSSLVKVLLVWFQNSILMSVIIIISHAHPLSSLCLWGTCTYWPPLIPDGHKHLIDRVDDSPPIHTLPDSKICVAMLRQSCWTLPILW